jgi:hypothetical protein
MIRQLICTLATFMVVGAGVAAQPIVEGEPRQLAMVGITNPLADPSPSPTLGSTPQPDRAPGDDNDGDSSDYTQVPLAVLAPLGLGAIVGGSVLLYFLRRVRRSRAEETRIRGGGGGDR